MGALVFVTYELSPFTPGGIGRVIHNILKSMSDEDRRRSVVLLLDVAVSGVEFASIFPSTCMVVVDTALDEGRFENFGRHPPRSAYSNTDFHWRSAAVFRALRELSRTEEIDYVEFPDWGGLGFVSVQEKALSGFLQGARLAVRLHSTRALILQHEASNRGLQDLNLVDLERKTLRDCDLVIGQLAPVAEATRRALDFSVEEWAPRLTLHAPPVVLDTRRPASVSLVPTTATPILFGSKIQRVKRPDLFVRGVNAFCNSHPNYDGGILFAAHSFDGAYHDSIMKLIPSALMGRYRFDASGSSAVREALVATSIFVAPSDFESFCLSAHEASLLGAVVVLNARNPAFGEASPWRDGENCIKFDGTALGLSQALERAFALEAPLRAVTIPAAASPWDLPPALAQLREPPAETRAPLVSVVVPHYNLAEHLPMTLASVLEQTHPNLEIVLVDDHSTDVSSRDLIDTLRQRAHEQFKVIVAPGNLGLPAARNLGVSLAEGKYILPLDAADLIDRRFIEIAVAALERNPEFDVVVPQAGSFESEDGVPLPGEARDFRDYAIFVGEALVNGVKENRFSPATALFRSDILRTTPYREGLSAYEDWALYLCLAQHGRRFLVTTDVYFFHRNKPGSMVKADRDPSQREILVHDMLRVAVDVKRLAPLSYLAFNDPPAAPCEIVRPAPVAIVTPAAPIEIVKEVWPFRVEKRELQRLIAHAAKREIWHYRVRRFFLYFHARSRRRYRDKLRLWKSVLRDLRDTTHRA